MQEKIEEILIDSKNWLNVDKNSALCQKNNDIFKFHRIPRKETGTGLKGISAYSTFLTFHKNQETEPENCFILNFFMSKQQNKKTIKDLIEDYKRAILLYKISEEFKKNIKILIYEELQKHSENFQNGEVSIETFKENYYKLLYRKTNERNFKNITICQNDKLQIFLDEFKKFNKNKTDYHYNPKHIKCIKTTSQNIQKEEIFTEGEDCKPENFTIDMSINFTFHEIMKIKDHEEKKSFEDIIKIFF